MERQGYEGNIAVCTTLVIRREHEPSMDAVWDRHKQWLQRTHGPMGLLAYTVAKSENGDDELVYVIHEVYRQAEGLEKHYELSGDGDYVDEFLRIAQAPGSTMTVLQGSEVTHSLLPKDLDYSQSIAAL